MTQMDKVTDTTSRVRTFIEQSAADRKKAALKQEQAAAQQIARIIGEHRFDPNDHKGENGTPLMCDVNLGLGGLPSPRYYRLTIHKPSANRASDDTSSNDWSVSVMGPHDSDQDLVVPLSAIDETTHKYLTEIFPQGGLPAYGDIRRSTAESMAAVQ